MSRSEQVLPDGWKPTRHSVVHVEASKDEPAPPHGLWRVFEKAPGTGAWWLTPVDDAARTWAARFPHQVQSGCISRRGTVLVPRGFHKPRPSDLSPAELARLAGGVR